MYATGTPAAALADLSSNPLFAGLMSKLHQAAAAAPDATATLATISQCTEVLPALFM